MNHDPDVIIIGAGLAGLATGVYAQRNGYRSRILEHHNQAGGVAAAWRRGDYLLDGGIHFAMGHEPGSSAWSLYEELGVVPTNHFTTLATYGRFLDETTGARLDVTRDLDRLAADLKALSPADAALVDDFLAGARAMRGSDLGEFGMAKPPEMAGRWGAIRELWSNRRLLRYMSGRYAAPVTAFAGDARDPRVRDLLVGLFSPDAPAFFILMILAMLADGQLAYIDGGCRDFVDAIAERYADLGGDIAFNATVEEILVENDRAVGVRLANGETHRAGAVVSAGDGYRTHFGLLGGRYLDDKTRRRYAEWPRFQPLLIATYGVARTFADEIPFTTIQLREHLDIGGRDAGSLFVRFFNYSSRFAPPGRTVVQVLAETTWDYWENLRRDDPDAYQAAKDGLAAAFLARLEPHWPGIGELVEVTDVATPCTFARCTLNHQGAWEGWMMTAQTMRTTIPRTLPGLGRFYMAGQWVMPGGGVVPVLFSGRHAVQLLCRDDGRKFAGRT